MNKKALAIALSKLAVFETPREELEQYPTDSEVAATLLHHADMIDGFAGKHVLDLGSGPGILAAGALLLGAQHATLMDIARNALELSERNLRTLGVSDRAEFVQAAVSAHAADIVVMNPPFGTHIRHADRAFLDAAFVSAPIIYSVHDAASEEWLKRYVDANGFAVTHAWHAEFPLKRSLPHHRLRIKRIPVVLVRLARM